MAGIWTWFHKLASPRWFYALTSAWLPWLTAAMVVLLAVGVTWALLFVPADYQQGETIRIMYVHVPLASLSLAFFPLLAVAGTITLVWRVKLADIAAQCAAPLGVWFTLLALASGSIWGSDIWGAWWVWDGRLTAMLLQLFLLAGMVSLRSALEETGAAPRACAVLALVGCVNVVVIKYSVEWWNTLHQPPSPMNMSADGPNGPEIWVPLLIMIAAMYLFLAVSLLRAMRAEVLRRERDASWVRELVAGA